MYCFFVGKLRDLVLCNISYVGLTGLKTNIMRYFILNGVKETTQLKQDFYIYLLFTYMPVISIHLVLPAVLISSLT